MGASFACFLCWCGGARVTPRSCMRSSHYSTSAFTLTGHCPNVLRSSGEPRGSIYHPNKFNASGASHPRGTNRWAEHGSGPFIRLLFSYTHSGGLGDKAAFKGAERMKASGLSQQEHTVTVLPDGGVWSTAPPRRSFFHCFFLFRRSFEVSRQKKVTPSWSCSGIVEVDGQQLSLASSLFSVFVLSVLVRILLIVEESLKLSVQCLGTKMFWWCTPRIPGISRVFQSYMNWDLGTPGSREQRDHHLEEKKEKRRHAVRSRF